MSAAGRPGHGSFERLRQGGISGGDPSLDYGYARVSARLASRPDEKLWRQLRSARSLQAAIDTVRGSASAPYVAGVAMRDTVDEIELAFRQHLRARIREVAAWAPQAWRAALRATEAVVDLPVLALLLAGSPPPQWLRLDPSLAAYAITDRVARRASLAQGPLAPLVAAAAHHDARRPAGSGRRGNGRLHPMLEAWQAQWQALWPACGHEQREALLLLVRTLRAHLAGFAALPLEATAASRERLAERLRRQLHDAAGQPAALFAYLLLVALDLERLRGEFALRAAGRAFAEAEAAA
jgi:hypothetical protein